MVWSLFATSLLGLETELGAERLLFLLLVAGALLDHAGGLGDLSAVTGRDRVVLAERRALVALEAGCNLVKLGNDGSLLLQLLLLGATNGLRLVVLLHVQVLALSSAHISHAAVTKSRLKLKLGQLSLQLGTLIALNIVDVLPEGRVGVARVKVVACLLEQLLLADERDDLVVVDRQDGIVAQHLRVLFK